MNCLNTGIAGSNIDIFLRLFVLSYKDRGIMIYEGMIRNLRIYNMSKTLCY
jgi:hypothetical protein